MYIKWTPILLLYHADVASNLLYFVHPGSLKLLSPIENTSLLFECVQDDIVTSLGFVSFDKDTKSIGFLPKYDCATESILVLYSPPTTDNLPELGYFKSNPEKGKGWVIIFCLFLLLSLTKFAIFLFEQNYLCFFFNWIKHI